MDQWRDEPESVKGRIDSRLVGRWPSTAAALTSDPDRGLPTAIFRDPPQSAPSVSSPYHAQQDSP